MMDSTATDRPQSSTLSNSARRFGENTRRNSLKYNFRVQSAPPLSIKQFLRSATGVIAGAKEWRPSGRYREPPFTSYQSPVVREKPKIVEPIWHPPGRFKEKPPTSLSPERIIPKPPPEPIWHPPGRYKEKPPTSLSPERIIPKPSPEPIWHPPGRFHEKPPTSLSPERIIPPRPPEPVWHAPGRSQERPPSSLSPERIIPPRPPEPVWRPNGKVEHKPVPYFDPPNLRWSLQELLRSMPEMRPKTLRVSRSMSAVRRSRDLQET